MGKLWSRRRSITITIITGITTATTTTTTTIITTTIIITIITDGVG